MCKPRSVDSPVDPSDRLVDEPTLNPANIGGVENEFRFLHDRSNALFFGASELPVAYRDIPNRARVMGGSKGGDNGFLADPIKVVM